MWLERRKIHNVSVRLDDYELAIVEDIARQLGIDKSEAIRRALWVYRILYDDNLKLKDALVRYPDPDDPLWKTLKPIPELAHIIGIEVKIYRKKIMRFSNHKGFN